MSPGQRGSQRFSCAFRVGPLISPRVGVGGTRPLRSPGRDERREFARNGAESTPARILRSNGVPAHGYFDRSISPAAASDWTPTPEDSMRRLAWVVSIACIAAAPAMVAAATFKLESPAIRPGATLTEEQ